MFTRLVVGQEAKELGRRDRVQISRR